MPGCSFITGIDGFIGTFLCEALKKAGDDVRGFSKDQIDITDGLAVAAAVDEAQPDRIWHLAAQSNISRSKECPAETFNINITGSINLFEAVREKAPQAVVISVGSSAEYGNPKSQAEALDEQVELNPSSPYGASKVSQGFIARLYAQNYNLHIIHLRPFGIIGPGKEGDALSDFCQGVVTIEAGVKKGLQVGNLKTVRDFMDVRDFIQAVLLVAERGAAGEIYNICNGVGVSLQEIIQHLEQLAKKHFTVSQAAEKIRAIDDIRLVGNNEKLRALGYQPQYSIEDTIGDTLAYWRAHYEVATV